jgi:papain like protease
MCNIYETLDFGYDPSVPEPVTPVTFPCPAVVPGSALVNSDYLPPVGQQNIPNCFVWSSTYGLVTFWAAQSLIISPKIPALQAAPDYTYIKVEQDNSVPDGQCLPGSIAKTLNWVQKNQGTAPLGAFPNLGSCQANWDSYKDINIADPFFDIPGFISFTILGSDGLDRMRTKISQGVPLAYCTYLYQNFASYGRAGNPIEPGKYYQGYPPGSPVGWAHSGQTEKFTGHCMMIIGYDDDYPAPNPELDEQSGAVLIQNSFGTQWGMDGYVWMGYGAFQNMAAGPTTVAGGEGLAFAIDASTMAHTDTR